MNTQTKRASRPPEEDAALLEIVEEVTRRCGDGENVDVEELVREHSEYERQLREMIPTLQAISQWAREEENASGSNASTDLPAHSDLMGRLGDFQIIREIGRGGMGVVYEAQQLSLRRHVALKVLPFAAMLDVRCLQRFQTEARAAAMLKHPNIVSVYSVGTDRGVHYYAMELVQGQSLSEVIGTLKELVSDHRTQSRGGSEESGEQQIDSSNERQSIRPSDTFPMGALSTDRFANQKHRYRSLAALVLQASEALHYAHEEGVIHRDVKPSNLMIDRDGKLWITDFGLARMRAGSELTMSGDLLGTLRYMSPEQASGNRLVDQRTDIYSLGITLYELLTLRPAFDAADRHALLRAVVEDEPPAPRKLDPSIPTDLETIALKAISKSADMRYQTAQELADDLRRFLEHKPVAARRPGRFMRLRRWARREPVLAAAMTLIFVLLTALATGGIAASIHLARQNDEASKKLYVADMLKAKLAVDQGDFFGAEQYLLQHVPKPGADDPRGFEWYHIWDRCHQKGPAYTLSHALNVFCVAYSPTEPYLATGEWNGRIHIWSIVDGSHLREIQAHGSEVIAIEYLPDGKTLVSGGRDGTVRLWDVESGSRLHSLTVALPGNMVTDISVLPDERLVAVGSSVRLAGYQTREPAAVSVWQIDAERELFRNETLIGQVQVSFSPDGQFLTAASFDGKVKVWGTADWRLRHSFQAHKAPIWDLAYSRDGTLATASGVQQGNKFVAGEVKTWNTADWSLRRELHCFSNVARSVAYSPDGRTIAVGCADGGLSLFDAHTGKLLGEREAHRGIVYGLAFSPKGGKLCSCSSDNTARVWLVDELVAKSPARGFQDHPYVLDVRFVSDDVLCTSDARGTVRVLDTSTGRVVHQIVHPGRTSTYLDTSPDGRLVAVGAGNFPPIETPARLHLYDVDSAEEIGSMALPNGFVKGLAFSPGGKSLAVASAEQLLIVDVKRQHETRADEVNAMIKCIAYSPDGGRLACGADGGKTHIYSARTHEKIRTLQTDSAFTMGVVFSPDGETLITGGSDRTIKTWDARTYELLHTSPTATPDYILHLAVSPDGRRYLSGGKDGSVTLWHAEVGEPILTLPIDHTWVLNGDFSPSGDKIAAGAFTGLRLWAAQSVRTLSKLPVHQLPVVCMPDALRSPRSPSK